MMKSLRLTRRLFCDNSILLNRCCRSFHKSSWRPYSKSPETPLLRQLQAKMRTTGAITVAEYMKEVLTNPAVGYYMHRDVFGTKGDFITSPEISQMFGELIAVWCVNEWMQRGSPKQLQVVELGPGRGTLADDMLRVFSKFPGVQDAVSVHLVEVSPKLSEIQQQKLSGSTDIDIQEGNNNLSNAAYRTCKSKYGPTVSWYAQLQDVPQGLSFYLAHEFFDALPIHKFQKQDGSWHEILVDICNSDKTHHLRYVLSPGETTATKLLFKDRFEETREHVELCPQGGAVVEEISDRIQHDGGFALIADYGHNGDKTDTFRAFREHKLFDPLQEPGTADLTADVDFSYLKKHVSKEVITYGPVTQENFLHNMGIGLRLQTLMGTADPVTRKNLITGYDMLTNPEKMGERFKFFAVMDPQGEGYLPAGFKYLSSG